MMLLFLLDSELALPSNAMVRINGFYLAHRKWHIARKSASFLEGCDLVGWRKFLEVAESFSEIEMQITPPVNGNNLGLNGMTMVIEI